MPMLAELPQIRPISDLRTKLNEIEVNARESGRPVVLTRNGAATLVVLGSEAFDEHLRHERAVRKLREAEIEAKYVSGSYSHEKVRGRTQQLLEALREAHA